jgi:hypothetical protein
MDDALSSLGNDGVDGPDNEAMWNDTDTTRH